MRALKGVYSRADRALRGLLGKYFEPVVYVFVGGINTVVGFCLYAVGLWLGLPYWLAALVSQILGTLFNYVSYGKVVFRAKLTGASLVRFCAFYTLIYVFSVSLLTGLQKIGMSAFSAGIVNGLCVPVLSYFLNRTMIFRRHDQSEST